MSFSLSNFLRNYPPGIKAIFGTQVFYNMGFYGFKSVFLLYMLETLALREQEGIEFLAAFMAITYATSLIGGYLADRFIGVKNTLITGGILSSIALFILAFSSSEMIYGAAALLCIGLGCFKPTFSSLLSLQFKDAQDPRRDNAFTFLYIAMNIGGFIGPLLLSFMKCHYGWRYGLLVLVASFIVGTFVFLKYSKTLIATTNKISLQRSLQTALILTALVVGIYVLFTYRLYFHGLMGVIIFGSAICVGAVLWTATSQERKDISKAILFILMFTIFCALFEQSGGSLILFFERFVNRQVMGLTLPANTLASLNPFLVLIFGVLLTYMTRFSSEHKLSFNGFAKFGVGFFFVSLSFAVLAFASRYENAPLPIVWILSAITLQTIGELLIVPTGFASISKLAPTRHLSLMMGLWLMAISYGHYLAGIFANYWLSSAQGLFEQNLVGFSQFFLKLAILPLIISSPLIFNIFRPRFLKK